METRRNNKRILKAYRKQLRSHGTAAEAVLWLQLKNKQLNGFRFRRQFSVDYYILDFYCPAAKLAIELDGAGHFTPEGREKDKKRDQHLENAGIKVLHFENKLLFKSMGQVLDKIKSHLLQSAQHK